MYKGQTHNDDRFSQFTHGICTGSRLSLCCPNLHVRSGSDASIVNHDNTSAQFHRPRIPRDEIPYLGILHGRGVAGTLPLTERRKRVALGARFFFVSDAFFWLTQKTGAHITETHQRRHTQMAHTMNFLLSAEAQIGRRVRANGYLKFHEPIPTHVVHVELGDNSFAELDADNEAHAMVIIHAWIGLNGYRSARYHTIEEDGSLSNASQIFDFRDFMND